jgi:hypothetical protein
VEDIAKPSSVSYRRKRNYIYKENIAIMIHGRISPKILALAGTITARKRNRSIALRQHNDICWPKSEI